MHKLTTRRGKERIASSQQVDITLVKHWPVSPQPTPTDKPEAFVALCRIGTGISIGYSDSPCAIYI
jgi:hypothetical protein